MRVRSELTRARLVLAVLLVALLPTVLAVGAALSSQPPPPPGPPAYNPVPLAREGLLTALQARELKRSRRTTVEAGTQSSPWIAPALFPERLPTLALPARPAPYTLAELRQLFPAVVTGTASGVLVQASVEVANGAHLVIDQTTPEVRLASGTDDFVSVIARGGTITVRGTSEQKVRISSWDAASGAPDREPADGRAFLLTLGGRMDIADADIGHLGFGTGSSSGVAWRGGLHTPGLPDAAAGGTVSDTVLHDNWFGAYTFEAQGMRWTGNTFADNAAYGFDPHDLSNDFVVQDNVAHGNGRHGFIFSRGCARNVLRGNVAYDNRGHGFMIDDGRTEDTPGGRASRLPSDHNVLTGNHAYDNDGSGIELEGGSGTVVTGNVLERNHVGIRIKDHASARVADNRLRDNALAGVDVLADVGRVELTGNRIEGGWAGIALGSETAARLTDNEIDASSTPLTVAGEAARPTSVAEAIGRVFRWNPVLVLWAAILGVPAVVGFRHILRVINRRRGASAAAS